MTIIFYRKESNQIYVCTENEPMKKIDSNDQHLLDFIPNDDILYIENAHIISKSQFSEWLKGDLKLETQGNSQINRTSDDSKKVVIHNESTINYTKDTKFIHTCHNGTVLIEDIETNRFPEGVALRGKWDFLAIEEIGEEILENSRFYKILLKNKKIEVVDFNYVKENLHKKHQHQSALDKAYDRILIKDDRRGTAERVADSGGLGGDGAIPIEIV